MADVAQGRGMAGRFGGDEFALLLTGLTDPRQAQECAEPGIALAELTRRADVAMYQAKASGKNRVETFRPATLVS